ncbi:MAG: hypothetical protein KKA07_01870 [Bacteroidetes bacterium]|nr:hypothetical protein [Bacteroidota bacterium]MBU1717798.1 hypothetical protein [Bacteroidota bacterium]
MKTFVYYLLFAAFISGILPVSFFNSPEPTKKPIVLSLTGDDYPELWKRVDSLTNKQLTQSALLVLDQIYQKAKTEQNHPQFVQSVIYRIRLKADYSEDYYQKIIVDVQNEIKISEKPVQNIMHSLLGELYWNFFLQNRWRFYNRTYTESVDPADINTWDLKTLALRVILEYRMSLDDPTMLAETKIDEYSNILNAYADARKFRPTLFDFLSYRAILIFMNQETGLTIPAESFKMDDPAMLGTVDQFLQIKLQTTDTLNLEFHALQLLQQVIAMHTNDAEPYALIDADLMRLGFVRNQGFVKNADSLYFIALTDLIEKYKTHPASGDAYYTLAVFYNSLPEEKPETTTANIKKAIAICDLVIEKWPNIEAATNCRYLLQQIRKSAVNLTMEEAINPGTQEKVQVGWKNTDAVHFRLIQISYEKYDNLRDKFYGAELVEKLLKLSPLKQWREKTGENGDLLYHTSEYILPVLKEGYYVLLCSNDSTFCGPGASVSYTPIWSTRLGYVQRYENKSSVRFTVLDRQDGKPVKGASVTAFYEKYNYITRTYERKQWKSLTTNADGQIYFPPIKSYKTFWLSIVYKQDRYVTPRSYNQYEDYEYNDNGRLHTFFFSDRAIYRPGQKIHFKGIMLKRKDESYEIAPNVNTQVYMYDANYQKIGDLPAVSNEYGTFSGTFEIPEGILTGQYRLSNSYGTMYFSVEEYKRPNFEVTVLPAEGTYKIGDSVTVSGSAKAYAGFSIDQATVKYRVVRTVRYPYFCWWWRYSAPYSGPMEIANGFTSTDADGKFNVTFKAIPDYTIDRSMKPVFVYQVSADVTDLNGETRSGSRGVQAGYSTLMVNLDLPEKVNIKDDNVYKFTTSNFDGKTQPSRAHIEIFKLKDPGKPLYYRIWSNPDRNQTDKATHNKLFPLFEYENEGDITSWPKEKSVMMKQFLTSADSSLNLRGSVDWAEGMYAMEIEVKDENGISDKVTKYFSLFNPESNVAPAHLADWFYLPEQTLEPGDTAEFFIASGDSAVTVLIEFERNGESLSKQWIKLSDSKQRIIFPIIEAHRGNIGISTTFVRRGRSFSHEGIITVPYTNKELDLEFSTFRSDLSPGQEEEWKLTVKGKNGEKVAAEMMASLYDASLDAFRANSWYLSLYPTFGSTLGWNVSDAFGLSYSQQLYYPTGNEVYPSYRYYDMLNWFGMYLYTNYSYYRNNNDIRYKAPMGGSGGSVRRGAFAGGDADYFLDGQMALSEVSCDRASVSTGSKQKVCKAEGKAASSPMKKDVSGNAYDKNNDNAPAPPPGPGESENLGDVAARKDFAETAFFYPQLQTDAEGNISIKFKMPESLTKYKFMGLAHTKDLMIGNALKYVTVKKSLMVIPNAPRFLREGDKIVFSAKITNLSETDLTGTTRLTLSDATTMTEVNARMGNYAADKSFTVKAGQSTLVEWELSIPSDLAAITYKVVAKAGNYSDGEERILPVLPNRMMVTESMPLPIRGITTKSFEFKKLINSADSKTLKHHRFTLEFTSNPAWYAIQALPYMMEYPYECTEQTFNRLYANSIASYIANSDPKIQEVFESWEKESPDALLSNLEKNQELKSVLLEQTPWVLEAKNETERKHRVGVLFNIARMKKELNKCIRKLNQAQSPNGGFPWFKGFPDSPYVTQYVVTGFGHLDKLGVKEIRKNNKIWNMVYKAVRYMDDRIREDFRDIKKYDPDYLKNQHIGYFQIQYLYARSYFQDISVENRNQEAFSYFLSQAQQYWTSFNRYLEGMIALAVNRYDKKAVATDIMKALTENALHSDEMGMYWSDITAGYYWYQAPIETMSLLIEAYDEVANDSIAVEDMKVWLLKNKQTTDWKTTRATADACYALLLRGTDVLSNNSLAVIQIGKMMIDPATNPSIKTEAGTGYFKKAWGGKEITPDMGKVTVSNNHKGVAWGAVYWQYFEDLDKITPHETPLKLTKKLFILRNTTAGEKLDLITEKNQPVVGDKIKVRIELKVDRDMEYIHMKDMRASCMEPTNVLSKAKYQDGLWYYESTRDASTDFFIEFLRKGAYVFEYPMFVTHKGDFSNGITTIQCMYAPEFTSHSEGIRVVVK